MDSYKYKLAAEISELSGLKVSADLFSVPPSFEMGELALPCFEIAKQINKTPNEAAHFLVDKLQKSKNMASTTATGPYLNIKLRDGYLVGLLEAEIENREFGKGQNKNQKLMVEFAHPNTHKAFHIGHLRNLITGESIVRILQNAGYEVIRANYQGDVGMHIAKALWGIDQLKQEFEQVTGESLEDKVKFLGKSYALGSQKFETDETVQNEIKKYNEKIYTKDESIKEVYTVTREWSLEYFNKIYARLNSSFDRFYFESEVFNRGRELVHEFLKKEVFKKSEGAIIFEGERFGLHNRVFVNSNDFPTYEAKDLALAELQFKEHNPDKIIHVVGKEQTEYFKVVFKALEQIKPETKGKEYHLAYGWVSLKHGKMSSRTGNVILGEWLLDEIEKKIAEIVDQSEVSDKATTTKKVSVAAVKYAMLKVGVKVDMAFDIDESVSISGDSGPYLLYIGARINSILSKAGEEIKKCENVDHLDLTEKKLVVDLLNFSEKTEKAAEELDPSVIAKYLFDLSQDFNDFYNACPVLQADEKTRQFRLFLIAGVNRIMKHGLNLLGIDQVDKM